MVTDAAGALAGVRVLDLTNVLSGPYCCYQLALMGAEVIKVEKPCSGDLARQLGADPARNENNMGVSFLAQNAGKKSITLNLKSTSGVELLKKLVQTADVLVENFRPGVMTRLGVDYPTLKQHNPALVYCAISGFGQTGPLSQRPAYDQIIQGLSGLMSITGDEESAPLRAGYPVADTVGGMAAAFAIAAALNARPKGAMIDVSMLESLVSGMGWVVSNFLMANVNAKAYGNENMTSAPSGTFRTASGLINIAANKDLQWQILVEHLQLGVLLEDPRFITREARKENREALKAELEVVLVTESATHWEQTLCDLGVPAGRVLNVEQTVSLEQLQSRQLFSPYQMQGAEQAIDVTASPFIINGARPAADTAPPELGSHNREIYQSLDIADEEFNQLQKQGVI